jgi:hypothetical protein
MMNGKQRARWLSDCISELQRFTSKAKDAPEAGDVRKALASLDDARRTALESHAEPDDPPQMEQ